MYTPPLYYLYLKLFVAFFGNSLIAMKIASVIPLSGTLALGATKIRKLFGDTTACLYLLFFACIPCTMEFSVQVRMYSLAVLCVTLCGVYAYCIFTEGGLKNYIWVGVSGVLAAYTHYFAFMSVIVIMLFLFIAILSENRKKLTAFCLLGVCMIAAYLPWFPYFYHQVVAVNQGYWIPEISADYVWGYFTWTFSLENLPWTVFLFFILLKAASTRNTIALSRGKRREEVYALACMLVPTVTMIAGVIISVCTTPIYREQYIFPSLALLALFLGIALRDAGRYVLAAVCAFLLAVGCGQYKECRYQEYYSTLLPQTEQLLETSGARDATVLYNYDTFGFIYEVQFAEKFPDMTFVSLANFDFSQDFDAVWFFDTEWQPDIDPSVLETYGLIMEPMGHFGIEHNEFDVYRICHAD